MTKICPNCGTENVDDSQFCKKCGTSLETKIKDKVYSNPKTSSTPKSSVNTKNILIIAITAILCVAIVAGAVVYLNSDGDFNLFASAEPIHIINTTFTTGNALSAKSTCVINVGENHSGENVTVSVLYSRDGSNLNDGDKGVRTVGEDGSIVVESKDSFKKYPDHAVVELYDDEGNLLDSVDVTLATDDSTQLAIGNGTVTATSITVAQHSAAANAAKNREWVEDLDLSGKAGYDCHVYIHHKSDGTKYYIDDEGVKHTGAESDEWVF